MMPRTCKLLLTATALIALSITPALAHHRHGRYRHSYQPVKTDYRSSPSYGLDMTNDGRYVVRHEPVFASRPREPEIGWKPSGVMRAVVHMARGIRQMLDTPCRIAASLGGPCGCFASEQFFGHSVRGLWRADSWYGFPRAEPGPGTAAVRPHHVVMVLANNHDGTVMVHDSWGDHRQSIRGWTFVRPSLGVAKL